MDASPLVERGALAFERRKRWHLAQLDVLELVARFGPEMAVGDVRAKTVCRMCAGRKAVDELTPLEER